METTAKRFVPTLAQEVALLRSSVIGLIGKDSEGEYRPEFVADTLKALNDATFNFSSPRDFLARIQNKKTKRS
ncbi:hypothetical protein HY415_00225 [Candidatus Kaiserbacteria bacterium]|nr:hypothetical protein [Candidatus Kaiserbacteria bacterium]